NLCCRGIAGTFYLNDTRNIVKSQATLRNSTQLFCNLHSIFFRKIENYFVSNAARLDGAAVLPRTFSHMSAWILQNAGGRSRV
ncbi:MAG: hypothetical protein LUG87_03070, partial [Oscillospiraceae bacterium]|nr:hypothetical protein [Oscillospiraceae bacterium]